METQSLIQFGERRISRVTGLGRHTESPQHLSPLASNVWTEDEQPRVALHLRGLKAATVCLGRPLRDFATLCAAWPRDLWLAGKHHQGRLSFNAFIAAEMAERLKSFPRAEDIRGLMSDQDGAAIAAGLRLRENFSRFGGDSYAIASSLKGSLSAADGVSATGVEPHPRYRNILVDLRQRLGLSDGNDVELLKEIDEHLGRFSHRLAFARRRPIELGYLSQEGIAVILAGLRRIIVHPIFSRYQLGEPKTRERVLWKDLFSFASFIGVAVGFPTLVAKNVSKSLAIVLVVAVLATAGRAYRSLPKNSEALALEASSQVSFQSETVWVQDE